MRAAGQTLVIGLDIGVSTTPFRYTDSAAVTGAGRGRMDGRQPVPVALWRPDGQTSAVRGYVGQAFLMMALLQTGPANRVELSEQNELMNRDEQGAESRGVVRWTPF